MRRSDVAAVLAACAVFDNRKIRNDEEGEMVVTAWYSVIGHLDLNDALEAVRRHVAESTEYIRPAHINQLARKIREERRRRTPHEARQLPSRFEPNAQRQITTGRGAATANEILKPILAKLAARADSDAAVPAIDRLRAITPGPDWAEEVAAEREGQ